MTVSHTKLLDLLGKDISFSVFDQKKLCSFSLMGFLNLELLKLF